MFPGRPAQITIVSVKCMMQSKKLAESLRKLSMQSDLQPSQHTRWSA